MKKMFFIPALIALILAIGLFPVAARGASREEVPTSCRFMWGIKAGFDFITADRPFAAPDITFERGGLGVNVGLTTRLQWRRWYLQPAISVSYDTQSVKLASFDENNEENYEAMRRGVVMVPIHLGYRFTLVGSSRMSLFTGGWVSYSFAGSLTADDETSLQTAAGSQPAQGYSMFGPDGIWSRISAGPAIGATLESTTFPLSITIDAYIGVTQMARKDIFYSNYMTESLARLSFVYWFRL